MEAVVLPGVVIPIVSGAEQDPTPGMLAGTAVFLLSLVMMLFLVLGLKLVTEVRPDGLYVRFVPLHRRCRHIPFDSNLLAVHSITYSIVDYGGWGIRWVPNGKAYNVRGNQGVRLDFANGRHLMIGSQRPGELAAAIEHAWSGLRTSQPGPLQNQPGFREDQP